MIGVIADDLTGAAEIGAVGFRYGLRAEVILGGAPGNDPDLICVDTDSRSCEPMEAARRAALAARLLRDCGVDWIYKKTDSILRGNVTPEIEAIVVELGLNGALLVPANPSLGRTVVDGQYYVRGTLIHETEFARDPEYPRLSSKVLKLLGVPSSLAMSVGKPGEPLPDRGFVIGEVASSRDLSCWATLRRNNWLLAGGAEFFGALLKPAASPPRSQPAQSKVLFVCGSASNATRTFVASQAQRGVPVFSLPDKVVRASSFESTEAVALAEKAVCELQEGSRVVLHVGLPQVENTAQAQMLAGHLVRVAEAVLRRANIGHVFAEGGATAAALARCMGWGRLKVVAELGPGVVTLSTMDSGARMFTIKPGSYAWPEFLLEGCPAIELHHRCDNTDS